MRVLQGFGKGSAGAEGAAGSAAARQQGSNRKHGARQWQLGHPQAGSSWVLVPSQCAVGTQRTEQAARQRSAQSQYVSCCIGDSQAHAQPPVSSAVSWLHGHSR